MRQILRDLKTGETQVVDMPVPQVTAGTVLIQTRCSLISAGTERMLAEFGRASLVEKALQQPDKVRMVLEKVRTDGLRATVEAVRTKLDQPLALGYCNVGTVIRVGAGVTRFKPGDRVVSNGSHASVVRVPENLCAAIPDGVDDETAVFAVVGAIGLQGLRLAQPTLGETVVVVGLGLIGLLTVQMLRAQGCRVFGVDFDPRRLVLARSLGAAAVEAGGDVVAAAVEFSRGRGVDAVLITASTTSNEPVAQAARMCRKRGRIVLVGVAGLELSRQDFYEKELSFQVSCSYGPGRYDPAYEQGGQDYPIGFVRWTAQRNFEAVLDLMASDGVHAAPLITHRFPLEQADKAYDVLTGAGPALGIVLEHPAEPAAIGGNSVLLSPAAAAAPAGGKVVIGCIGAGNYASRMLIPALADGEAQLHTIVSPSGVNAVFHGKRFGFAKASTDCAEVFAASEINTVVVASRHDSHAALAAQALRSGRHVYVEKPLALTGEQLDEVKAACTAASASGRGPLLMVGFNRRFAPHVQRMRQLLQGATGPKALNLLMNAGAVPAGHWTQDRAAGGGRILGEACHLVDLARFLVGAPITRVKAAAAGGRHDVSPADTAAATLEFADGSIASIQYYANGHRGFPKERVEAFVGGHILQLDNFRILRGYGWPDFRVSRSWSQDKGNAACVQAFVHAVATGGASPIPAEEIFEVSRVSIELAAGL